MYKLPFKLWPFGIAYAFYSEALHTTQPASTYGFGRRMSYWGLSCTVNLVWYGITPLAGIRALEKKYPDVTMRGFFLTGRQLVADVGLVKVAGPAAPLGKNGPLQRPDPQPSPFARRRLIRLVSVRDNPGDSGPNAA